MAALTYREPVYIGQGGTEGPTWDRIVVGSGAAFRRGALLVQSNTGTVSTPAPTGSMSTTAGPAASAVTFGQSASAGAPGGTFFAYLTYTATSNESLPAGPYAFTVAPGNVLTINVASAGAPAAATNFAAYVSTVPTLECLQQATRTTTALGATFTCANPLTNSYGISGAATNVASGLIGIAASDSNAAFFSGIGGSASVGNASVFGALANYPPLDSIGAMAIPICKLAGSLWEFSLVQPYSPALDRTTAGITLDATTGFYVVDTSQSNKIVTIQGASSGPSPFFGSVNDTGARVRVTFSSSALA